MKKKEIKIITHENIASDLADIICFFNGFLAGKGESYSFLNEWLVDALNSLKDLKVEIEKKLKENKSNDDESNNQ